MGSVTCNLLCLGAGVAGVKGIIDVCVSFSCLCVLCFLKYFN